MGNKKKKVKNQVIDAEGRMGWRGGLLEGGFSASGGVRHFKRLRMGWVRRTTPVKPLIPKLKAIRTGGVTQLVWLRGLWPRAHGAFLPFAVGFCGGERKKVFGNEKKQKKKKKHFQSDCPPEIHLPFYFSAGPGSGDELFLIGCGWAYS